MELHSRQIGPMWEADTLMRSKVRMTMIESLREFLVWDMLLLSVGVKGLSACLSSIGLTKQHF